MSLSAALQAPSQAALACAGAAVLAYALAAVPQRAGTASRGRSAALVLGWLLHLCTLMLDISGYASEQGGPRLGFAPVLSASVWLVVAVHAVESRFVPVPAVRVGLAVAGAAAIGLGLAFPGELRPFASVLGPWHFLLGVATYALVAAAVLHGLWLGAAENRLRQHKNLALNQPAGSAQALGMPLLQLERLTFRFVQAGFGVLTLTLLLGLVTPQGLRPDHKTVLSLLAWICFAVLIWGRASRGWRGRSALRWLYGGAALLLLAYAGSRFVFEVLLGRPWP